jgi:hypothetical protein
MAVTIDGPFLNRQWLGLPSPGDVSGGAALPPLDYTKCPVISGQGATSTLTAYMSGSTCLFDRAAGIVYTLPAPQVGLWFQFMTTVSITSNAAEVDVAGASIFLGGSVFSGIAASATSLASVANGTSHVKIASNGTTTGGLQGSAYTIYCVSPTLWQITGSLVGSGTLATPFA